MDAVRPPHSSVPLVSRLDHLDFIMKRLESKQDSAQWSSRSSARKVERRDVVPLDLAVREAYFKGSLLDRVASLEHRLLQLCLDMDSSSSSRTSGETSSSLESKREASGSSSSTFVSLSHQKREPDPPRVHQHVTEIQEEPKSGKVARQKTKNSSSPGKMKIGKSKTSGENSKKPSNKLAGRNGKPGKWLHLSLLGC